MVKIKEVTAARRSMLGIVRSDHLEATVQLNLSRFVGLFLRHMVENTRKIEEMRISNACPLATVVASYVDLQLHLPSRILAFFSNCIKERS